jgi:hypothetical protein
MNNDHQDARMILALAAETDDEFLWGRIKTLQPEMFAAGPVQIKFAYFGREGELQTRPCITTNWVTDADDMAEIMDRGRRGCVCGCYIEIGGILEQALQETRQRPVQAVVIVGDHFHGDLDAAVAAAKQLRAPGTRLFLFQQGRSDPTERAFRILVETRFQVQRQRSATSKSRAAVRRSAWPDGRQSGEHVGVMTSRPAAASKSIAAIPIQIVAQHSIPNWVRLAKMTKAAGADRADNTR